MYIHQQPFPKNDTPYIRTRDIYLYIYLLFIDVYNHSFNISYPILTLNHDELYNAFQKTKNKDLNFVKKFNEWWKYNKYFYENLNNCKYNIICENE